MVNDQDFAGAVAGTSNNTIPGSAQASLRRNAGLEADEDTPLLRSDRRTTNGTQAAGWEGYADLEGLKWYKRPSVYWLLPPFFLFALALGGIIVPKLNLILSLVCRDYLVGRSIEDTNFLFTPVILGGENPQCRVPKVQALVTEFTLALTIVTGVLSAIMSPQLGAISDRFGRRNILLISSSGALLTEIITIAVVKYPDTIHYKWLLAGAVFDGLCGSLITAMAISYAYAADCTAPPRRAVAFGYFHACLFGGIALGPLLAAFLFRLTGVLLSIFYVALGIHLFFISYLILVVPESLSKKRQIAARERHTEATEASSRIQATWMATFKHYNLLASLKVLWPTGPGSSNHLRANLILLAGVDIISFGVAMGAMTVVVYYTGFQFGWDTGDTSIFVSIVNTTRVSALLILMPLLNYIVRTRRANRQRRESGFSLPEPNSGSDTLDLATIRTAIFLEFLGYLGYTLSRSPGFFVLSGIVAALGGMGSPTLQSSLTKHVPHDMVGRLLGATGLLHALARVVCPLIFNMIYAKTVGKFTQTVFVVLTACFGTAFVASWFVTPHVYLEETNTTTTDTTTTTNTKTNTTISQSEIPHTSNPDLLIDEEIAGI